MDDLSFWRMYFVVGFIFTLANSSYSCKGFMRITDKYNKPPLIGLSLLFVFSLLSFLFWPIFLTNRVLTLLGLDHKN